MAQVPLRTDYAPTLSIYRDLASSLCTLVLLPGKQESDRRFERKAHIHLS